MMWASKRSGFTIVELLVVVVVIAILAAITIVAYNGIQERSRQSINESNVASIAKKVSVYAIENGDNYPASLNDIGIIPSAGTTYDFFSNNLSSPRTFCVTSKTGASAAHWSSTDAKPETGACPIVNLVRNPSLESSQIYWTSSSSNINPQRVLSGGNWLFTGTRVDSAAAAMRASFGGPSTVTVGQTYTASANVYSSVARTLTLQVRIGGTATAILTADHSFSAGETKRISVTGTLTNSSVYVALLTTSGSAGETYTMDDVMLTEGSTVYSYADGNSTDWTWSGTPNESTSSGPATF